jgi:hypothetical protein
MSTHALPNDCPNCSAAVSGPFCAACGQETVIETPTVIEFLHETLHHYVAAEGKIWRTLMLLLCVPGELTHAYLIGRRKRYIRPIQLYLTLSFVFFLIAGLTGSLSEVPENIEIAKGPEALGKAAALDPEDLAELRADPAVKALGLPEGLLASPRPANAAPLDKGPATGSQAPIVVNHGWVGAPPELAAFLEKISTVWQKRVDEAGGSESRAVGAVIEHAMHRIPMALFILMPLLAVILKFFYIGRGMPYGGHLLFAIHLHAFMFALLTILLIPMPGELRLLVLTVIPTLYLALAMRRVYGGHWLPLILRTAAVESFYGVAVMTALLALFIVSFFY